MLPIGNKYSTAEDPALETAFFFIAIPQGFTPSKFPATRNFSSYFGLRSAHRLCFIAALENSGVPGNTDYGQA